MSYSEFKYCPFCGSHIPNNNMVKYCPFCGGHLLLSDNKTQGSQHDENILFKDNLVLKKMVADYDEHAEINFDMYNKTNMGKIVESEYYSIVLKHAPNRQSLIHKLEKILLRGYFAIRLAVDNMPSLIIYKAKGDDVVYLNEIFAAEQASTSVMEGDFDHNPVVEELFAMSGNLSAQTRQTIKQIPVKLWVGDRILGIFPNNYRENSKGIMIITDKGIYFLPDDIYTSAQGWFVRSYNILSRVVIQDNCLQFTYKDVKVTDITFSDKQKLFEAYHCIDNAIQISQ